MPITRLGYGQGELVEARRILVLHLRRREAGELRPATADHQPEQPRTDDARLVDDRRVFYPGEHDPDGEALRDFAQALLIALEPILPARPRRVLRSLTPTTRTARSTHSYDSLESTS